MSPSILERQALDSIHQYYALRKTVPDAQKLAVKYGVELSVAQGWIEQFLTTNGKQEIVKKTEQAGPTEALSPKKQKNPLRFIDFIIDGGSLIFAVAVDLVLNGIGFWVIGPDPVMKIGMVCVSVIVVLFSVRAWVKQNIVLWAMFAFVASFMDASFILVATDVQDKNNSTDTELISLTSAENRAQAYLDNLRELQLQKGEGYRTQIQDALSALDSARSQRLQYIAKPIKATEVVMTSSKVFTAIPDAANSGKWDRWIALILCALIFPGLQLTIISATGVKYERVRNRS